MPPRQTLLLGGFFANFAVFGAAITLFGATAPGILRQTGWSYPQWGALLAVDSAAYLSATFIGGVLVRRFGAKPVLIGGLGLAGAGLAAFGAWPSLAYNIACIAVVGLGQGGLELATNYAAVRLGGSGSRLMNLLHAAFTVGAVTGPLAIGALLGQGVGWRAMFAGVAALTLGQALFFALVSFEAVGKAESTASSTAEAVKYLARRPLVALLALLILVYVGVEIGISNWLAEYYVDVFGASEETGAYMVSLFWGGLLVGRLAASWLYRSHRQAPLLLGLTLAAAAGLVSALAVGGPWAAAVLFAVCGLGLSAVYPVVMVLTGRCARDEQEIAIGLVASAGGIGALAFPGLVALLAERFGLEQGFWFFATMAVLMVLIAAEVWRRVGREDSL